MPKDQLSLIDKAVGIALTAHAGQKDKAGAPYILHPLRLMLQMATEAERLVAVLHDVVEDSGYTLKALRVAGFPETVVTAVGLLTHKKADTYDEFVAKVKPNALARAVKIADLRDNLNLKRIKNPTEKDFSRMEKYKKALTFCLTLSNRS